MRDNIMRIGWQIFLVAIMLLLLTPHYYGEATHDVQRGRGGNSNKAVVQTTSSKVLTMPLRQHRYQGFVPWGPPHHSSNMEAPVQEMWSLEGLSIGTPPQPLLLMADTGSASTVPMLASCTTKICRQTSAPLFNAAQSTSYEVVGSPMRWGYGAGNMLVHPVQDVLTLHATKLVNKQNYQSDDKEEEKIFIFVSNYSFLAAYNVTASSEVPDGLWEALLPSGVIGLQSAVVGSQRRIKEKDKGKGKDGIQSYPPAFSELLPQLMKANVISENVIGFLWTPTNIPNATTKTTSSRNSRKSAAASMAQLTLGGVNPHFFRPPIVWMNGSKYNRFVVLNVTVDGKPAPVACQGPVWWHGCAATIDSGGGLLNADIGMQYTIGTDCAGFDQLPVIEFLLLGALKVTLTPNDYVFKRYEEDPWQQKKEGESPSSSLRCYSGLAQLTTVKGGNFTATSYPAAGVWILAGRFFSKVYSVLAATEGGTQFGFAAGVHPPSN